MELSKEKLEDRFFFALGLIKKGYDNNQIKIRVEKYEEYLLKQMEKESIFNFNLNFQMLQYKVFKESERLAKYYRNMLINH